MDSHRATTPVHAKAPDGTAVATRAPGSARKASSTVADTTPTDVLEKIRSQLGEGRYRDAQNLAREAAARFPEHPEVALMNSALNKWTAKTRPATGVDRDGERVWMRQELPESLHGKVVALVGREVIAAADTLTELGQQLRSMELSKRPLVFRVA